MSSRQHSLRYTAFRLAPLVALIAALFAPSVHAASFTINDGETVTTQQTLGGNESGVVQSGGTLNFQNATTTYAINIAGANNTVTNNGAILTTGGSAYTSGIHIDSSASNTRITNHGTIATSGGSDRNHGIYAEASGAAITNTGTITVTSPSTGPFAYGIFIADSTVNATIANSGTIAVTNNETGTGFALGIYSGSANATLINSGTISATGKHVRGMSAGGDDASIVNSGTMMLTGAGGGGIAATGNYSTVSNTGVISTTGVFTRGIESYGINTTITNSGTISTAGEGADGILLGGNNATINHSGTITVSGANAIGIRVGTSSGNTTTVNVSGSITATGSATQAIVGGTGNETLNLHVGAKIVGSIDLGTGTNTVNIISGAGASGTYDISTTNTTINQTGSGLSFVNGGAVAMVDTTNLTAGQATLGVLSSNIAQSVNTQLNSPVAMHRPLKVASNGSDAGLWANDTRPMAWGRVFGKYTIQDSRGAALGFRDHSYGVIGGVEQSLGDHRAGLFGGISQSNTDMEQNAGELDSNGIFGGMYGQYVNGNWRINGALAVGYANYDSDRQVTDNVYGAQTASADYEGWYVSPSVALMHIFEQGAGLSIRPSVEVNYTYGRQGSYTESGTTRSNLSVGSRTAQVLNTRLQLAMHQDFLDRSGQVELRGGLSHTHYGNDSTPITLQGVGTTHYSLTGTGDLTGAYAGFNTRYHYKDRVNIVGDIEVFNSDGFDFSIMAYAGVEYWF